MVTVGFSNDMDEWLIACTGTVDEFGANNAGEYGMWGKKGAVLLAII